MFQTVAILAAASKGVIELDASGFAAAAFKKAGPPITLNSTLLLV